MAIRAVLGEARVGLLAEGVGFEPTEVVASHVFKTCPFGRSGNPPLTPL